MPFKFIFFSLFLFYVSTSHAAFENVEGYKQVKFGMTFDEIKALKDCNFRLGHTIGQSYWECNGQILKLLTSQGFDMYESKHKVSQISVPMGDFSQKTFKAYDTALSKKYGIVKRYSVQEAKAFDKGMVNYVGNFYGSDKGLVILEINRDLRRGVVNMVMTYFSKELSPPIIEKLLREITSDDI